MQELTQGLFLGTWKSFKVFRKSGEVKQHTSDSHMEVRFEDCNALTILHKKEGATRKIANSEKWNVYFKDKRYYLETKAVDITFEIITINHVSLVLQDLASNDKFFFARPETWVTYINTSPAATL